MFVSIHLIGCFPCLNNSIVLSNHCSFIFSIICHFTFTNKWVDKKLEIKLILIIKSKKESQYGMIINIIRPLHHILKVAKIKCSSDIEILASVNWGIPLIELLLTLEALHIREIKSELKTKDEHSSRELTIKF